MPSSNDTEAFDNACIAAADWLEGFVDEAQGEVVVDPGRNLVDRVEARWGYEDGVASGGELWVIWSTEIGSDGIARGLAKAFAVDPGEGIWGGDGTDVPPAGAQHLDAIDGAPGWWRCADDLVEDVASIGSEARHVRPLSSGCRRVRPVLAGPVAARRSRFRHSRSSSRATTLKRIASGAMRSASNSDVADVLGHNGTAMAALVYRHVLAPTVEAGAAPMQALLGEPGEGMGSPDGSRRRDNRAQDEADER